jgi:hypothetical protein
MSAIVFGSICLDVGPRKLVVFRIDRTDLPHLTCSWNNPSGEVDIHLTPASPRDEDDRESILRVQESELMCSFRRLVKQICELVMKNPIEVVWSVNPKWLRNRGYTLVGPKEEQIGVWLLRALPKRRGKHRLDERVLKQPPKMTLYKPTVQHFVKLGKEGQVYAISTKGPYRGTILALQPIDLGLFPSVWAAFNYADIANLMKAIGRSRLLPNWFDSLAPGAWDGICKALQLREIGF